MLKNRQVTGHNILSNMLGTKDTYATALSIYGYPILVRFHLRCAIYELRRNYREFTIHPDQAQALLAYTKAIAEAEAKAKADAEARAKAEAEAKAEAVKAESVKAEAKAKAIKAKAKVEQEIDEKIFKYEDIFRLYILDEKYDKNS